MAMAIGIKSGDILSAGQLSNHIKVYAGPGAGKTHFLVENVKNILVSNPLIQNSRYRKVCCITYTNAAVDVMKSRLGRQVAQVDVNTIHGFIIEHIIMPFQDDLIELMYEDFGIAVKKNKGKITSQIEGLAILHGVDREKIYDFVSEHTQEQSRPGYNKKMMGDVEVDTNIFIDNGVKQIKASNSILVEHKNPIKQFVWSEVKKLTHNEILYFGYRILQRNSTALYAVRVKFPFIFVDEFQDTSPLQSLLIKLIAEKSTIVGVIGDIAQSIYSFQGARPSKFLQFSIDGGRTLQEFEIAGNRRSTSNIVNFCDYLRQSDSLQQNSIKPYKNETEKILAETGNIQFLLGNGVQVNQIIRKAIENGGVVLTRVWAAAFAYIQGITATQHDLLKKIYNHYYNSPIDIRTDIIEQNNVTWVRAVKFIFSLWESHKTGSFIDVIKAHSLYVKDIRKKKLQPKTIIQIKSLTSELFASLVDSGKVVDVIERFNFMLTSPKFSDYLTGIFGAGFFVSIFDELDKDELKNAVRDLEWGTAYKLFNEVFSKKSKYMTVHQSKGLEWDTVVVSVVPNKASNKDNTTLGQMYAEPQILEEKPEQEFTRMYYVACSRAIKNLIIHLPQGIDRQVVINALAAFSINSDRAIGYEFVEN
jgi:superfamily I DNA/RNA helicase